MIIGSNQTYTEAQNPKVEHMAESYAGGDSFEDEENYAVKDVSSEHAAYTRRDKSASHALEEQSISALRSKARKKRISGRSTMNKVELIMALRQAR